MLTMGLDLIDGLFPITCCVATQSRVHYRVPWVIQTLSKGCDPIRAKVPFIRAIRTSVRFVFSGPYGTRTRDLRRDRAASTPTGLTDQ